MAAVGAAAVEAEVALGNETLERTLAMGQALERREAAEGDWLGHRLAAHAEPPSRDGCCASRGAASHFLIRLCCSVTASHADGHLVSGAQQWL